MTATTSNDVKVFDATFREDLYLLANPDVAGAVLAGAFDSGFDHYQRFGQQERRPLVREPSREDKLLASIDKHMLGLEIGPSHRPIAPKRAGFNVRTLDHLDADGLKAKYASHGHDVDVGNIEEVDYVWHGEHLADLVGGERFHWIIASHVIEHTPDLIGFVNDCEAILTDDGILSLAVPDMRYCFDHFREVSALGRVVDAHLSGATRHSEGTAAEYFLNVTCKGANGAWDADMVGDYTFIHDVEEASSIMARIAAGEYVDLHAWCFTPSSFRLLVEDLSALHFIAMREQSFHPTVGHEFFVTLSKSGSGPALSRMALVQQKIHEVAESAA